MLKSNWVYLINLALLVGYFSTGETHQPWPDTLVWWPWLLYLAHMFVHNFVDGFQNTTRNLARISLIQKYGQDYDTRLVAPIQQAMVPSSMVPITFLWWGLHISSFAALLFYQGWGTAITGEVLLAVFGWVLPINYKMHLEAIRKHIDGTSRSTKATWLEEGADYRPIKKLVVEALKKEKSPQEWWAELVE